MSKEHTREQLPDSSGIHVRSVSPDDDAARRTAEQGHQHPICPGLLDDTIDRESPVVPKGSQGLVSEPAS